MWICFVNGKSFYFVANQVYKIGRAKDADLSFPDYKYLSRIHIEFSFIQNNNGDDELIDDTDNDISSPNFHINILPQPVQFTVVGQTGCEVDVYDLVSKKNPLLILSDENDSSNTTPTSENNIIEDETEDLTKSKKYRRLESHSSSSSSGFEQTKAFPKSDTTRISLPENQVWRFRLRIGSTIVGKNNNNSSNASGENIVFDFRWVPSILLTAKPMLLPHQNGDYEDDDDERMLFESSSQQNRREITQEAKMQHQQDLEKYQEFRKFSSLGGFSVITYSTLKNNQNNNNENALIINRNQNLIRSLKLSSLSALVSDNATPSDHMVFTALCAKKPIICRQIIINYVKKHDKTNNNAENNNNNISGDDPFQCRVAPPRFDAPEALFPEKHILLSQSDNKAKEINETNFDREWTQFVVASTSSSESLKEMMRKINLPNNYYWTGMDGGSQSSFSSSSSMLQNNNNNNNHVFNRNRCQEFQKKLLPTLQSNQDRFSIFENLHFVTLNEETRQELIAFVDLCDFVRRSPSSSNRVHVDSSLYTKTQNANNNNGIKITSTASSVKSFLQKHTNENEASNHSKNHILVISPDHDEEFFTSSALNEMRKIVLTKMTVVRLNDVLRSIFEAHRLFFSFSEFVVSEYYQTLMTKNNNRQIPQREEVVNSENENSNNNTTKTSSSSALQQDSAVVANNYNNNNNNNFFQIGPSLAVDEIRNRLLMNNKNNESNNTNNNNFSANFGEDAAQQNTRNLFSENEAEQKVQTKKQSSQKSTKTPAMMTMMMTTIKQEKNIQPQQDQEDQDESGMILPALKREPDHNQNHHDDSSANAIASHREDFIRTVNNIPKIKVVDDLELSSQQRTHIIPNNIPCYMNFDQGILISGGNGRNRVLTVNNNNYQQQPRSSSQKVFRKQKLAFDDSSNDGEFKVKLEDGNNNSASKRNSRNNNNNNQQPSMVIANADNFFSVSTLQLPLRRQRKDDELFETSNFVASTKNHQKGPIINNTNKNMKNDQDASSTTTSPSKATKERLQPLTREEIQRAQGFLQHYANASANQRRIDADDLIGDDTDFGDFNRQVLNANTNNNNMMMMGVIDERRRLQLEHMDYCYDHQGVDSATAWNRVRAAAVTAKNNNNNNNYNSSNLTNLMMMKQNNNNNKPTKGNNKKSTNNNNMMMMMMAGNDDDDCVELHEDDNDAPSSSKKKKPSPKKAPTTTRGRKKKADDDDDDDEGHIDDDVVINVRTGNVVDAPSPPAKKARGKKAVAAAPPARSQQPPQQQNQPRGIFDIDDIFNDTF